MMPGAPKKMGGHEVNLPKGGIAMDHSNPNQKTAHIQCAHGMCLYHDPKWENVGEERREPMMGVFGQKTHLIYLVFCCKKPMARYKIVQMQRCAKCGRTRNFVKNSVLAVCRCCGYHFDNMRAR